jgi:hypothetical protein
MARARKVISDQSSQEFDELRRQFNNLLQVLQRAAREEADGTTTALQAAEALATSIETGVDSTTVTGHVNTGRELNGVRPTPTHPRRARDQGTEEMDDGSDY